MKITRIRIPAEFRLDDTRTHTAVADFTLGAGPCGKTVQELQIAAVQGGTLLEVHQFCTDGTLKVFGYPVHTMTGRYEVTYEMEGEADGD